MNYFNKSIKFFNIYYKSKKINKMPITESEVNNIISRDKVYKMLPRNKMLEIPTNKIKVVKCTII